MFGQFHRAAAILALIIFAWSQHQGWSLFENIANPGRGGPSGASRVYHK